MQYNGVLHFLNENTDTTEDEQVNTTGGQQVKKMVAYFNGQGTHEFIGFIVDEAEIKRLRSACASAGFIRATVTAKG